jgi:glycosyltransferase involved in cell wall biosynthesis
MAALVVCPSFATRDALLAHKLISEEQLRVVPLGAHPSCSPQSDLPADAEVVRLLGERRAGDADLVHVASTIPRKRIDLLLRVFAEVKRRFPRTRLIRAGGPFTAAQESMVDELRLRDSIIVLPHLDRRVLAAVYRRAAIVLLTSEREGFGLPVLEAMACGTPVVASDLPSVREVGGDSAVYCPIGGIPEWADAVSGLLEERRDDSDRWQARRDDAVTHATRFSWDQYTLAMVKIYREIASGMPGGFAS